VKEGEVASEVLAVPEEDLADVIAVIRAGLSEVPVASEVFEHLSEWCDGEEAYLEDMAADEDL
jgi:NCAIR mutase (PurE)-related protein